MALHEIIYVSLAQHEMTTDELATLLEQSRVHNARCGITGMLLYHRQEFMQLIEGEEAEVRALFETICNDPRHQQIHKMWEGTMAQRSFSSWHMGFVAPDDEALRARPGYEPLLARGLIASRCDSVGKRMLLRVRDDFLSEA